MWYDQLLAESLGKNELGATPLTVVNTRDFPAGNYRIACRYSGGSTFVSNNFYAYDLPANGSKQIECWLGADGYDVWVDLQGWGDDVDTEKQWWPRG